MLIARMLSILEDHYNKFVTGVFSKRQNSFADKYTAEPGQGGIQLAPNPTLAALPVLADGIS
jgi:hypothetical protein